MHSTHLPSGAVFFLQLVLRLDRSGCSVCRWLLRIFLHYGYSPLRLEAGVPYVVSFDGWVNELASGDNGGGGDSGDWGDWGDYYSLARPMADTPSHNNVIHMLIGQDASEAAMTELEVVDINVKAADKVNCKVYFSVETSGTYYIGFKATTQGYSDKKYVDNIKVEKSKTIPATVTDLKADTNLGADEALVSFTLPTLTNTGAALSTLDKAEVTRYDADGNATVVKTLQGDDCTPGASVSFTDQLPVSGKYSYSVVSWLGDDASEIATTQALRYGYDYPKSLSSFGITVNTDGNAPVISWNALSGASATLNGGYIDMSALKYRVYRRAFINDSSDEASFEFLGEVESTTFTDEAAITAPWNKYFYNISVVNGDKEGARVERTPALLMGDAVEMPYTHDFSTDKMFDILEGRGWYSEKDNANGGYTYRPTTAVLPRELNTLSIFLLSEAASAATSVAVSTSTFPAPTLSMRKILKYISAPLNPTSPSSKAT